MDQTKVKGNITELMCMAEFIKLGYQISIPYGNSAKYDFIVDVNGKFFRIQCKSSHTVHDHGKDDPNAFSFCTTSQTTNTKCTKRHSYTKDDIDYFATWYQDKVYLVPVEEASTSKTLRFNPPKCGGTYNKAEDYLLEKVFTPAKTLLQSKQSYIDRITELQKTNLRNYCKDCGKEITLTAVYCKDCNTKHSRKTKWPERDELKTLIRNKAFTQISKLYGVSDKAITKWCKYYKLPYKRSEIKKISDKEWINI